MNARLGDREADFEVAVIGGGVAGATLAAILGATGLRVALVESSEAREQLLGHIVRSQVIEAALDMECCGIYPW